jgi:putative transposase
MFERIVTMTLPDGRRCRLYPFHVCIKGVSDAILCRDDEDFDVFVKYIHICAWRKNVLVVVYIVMSNHVHVTILAPDQETADAFAVEIKRMFSMFFAWKYGRNKVLKYVDDSAFYLDTNSYLRNSVAYTLKNSLDAGCKVDQYEWSAYKAVFPSVVPAGLMPVSRLSSREAERIFHTNMDISSTGWKIDDKNRLDPSSACVTSYAEAAFNNDISFFYRALGVTDNAIMAARFMDGPRTRLNDQDFFRLVTDTAERWFSKKVDELSLENKTRLVPYIYHVTKTTPAQIARGLGLEKAMVERLVKPR